MARRRSEVIRREDATAGAIAISRRCRWMEAGRLWIGYFDRGLQILARAAGTASLEDDHLFCVNRIAHDSARGVSAVATANGLVMFDASTARGGA